MTRFILITLSGLWLLPATTWAEPDQAGFMRALTTRERIPTRAGLLRLDPQAEHALQALVNQSSTRALARSRAISLLQLFPSKGTAATLLEVIKSASHPRAKGLILKDLGRALTAYAVVMGPKALPQLTPFLAHGNPDVRLEAARALRLSKNEAALKMISSRLKVETTPFVRAQLKKQIAQIQRATSR